jgi:hypothetical protein
MKPFHKFLLSLFSGLLLSIGWPERGFPVLLFAGFVPLLLRELFSPQVILSRGSINPKR